MIEFTLNGEKSQVPVSDQSPLSELVSLLQDKLRERELVISAIELDGKEISEEQELELQDVPLKDLPALEFKIAPAREVLGNTLNTLLNFNRQMIFLARRVHLETDLLARQEGLIRLADWIEIFHRAIKEIKGVLRVGLLPPVNLLEADLHEILVDVLDARQRGDEKGAIEIVGTDLVDNLDQWYQKGIPALIRREQS